jgi:hypothetical protein
MRKIFLFITVVSSACLLKARPPSGIYNNAELDELRIELDDSLGRKSVSEVKLLVQ